MKNSLALPAFLIVVGYLVFAGLASWWPWNVPVVLNQNSPSPTPTPTPTVIPTLVPVSTPELTSASPSNQYSIQCQEEAGGEVFRGQPWYEYLKGRILPGWYMTSVCYNAELNSAIYFRSQINPNKKPDPDLDYYSQFGIYDIAVDDFVVGPKKKIDLLGGCGPVDAWLRIGQIIYGCGGRDGPLSFSEIYSFDIESQTHKLTRRCAMEVMDNEEMTTEKKCVDSPEN